MLTGLGVLKKGLVLHPKSPMGNNAQSVLCRIREEPNQGLSFFLSIFVSFSFVHKHSHELLGW